MDRKTERRSEFCKLKERKFGRIQMDVEN
jgi:hypothetical protein